MRLRRCISRNKDSRKREGNLILTNSVLREMKLKSLVEIKEKYGLKKKYISQKKRKKEVKTGKTTRAVVGLHLEEIEFKYTLKAVLRELKELASLVKKQEKEIQKIRKKLER